MLINKGALVNEKDNMSNTPMHCAALHGQNTIICLLVSNGANCCELGKLQKMLWYIDYNFIKRLGHPIISFYFWATVIIGFQGNTMLHLAASRGHFEMVKYFVNNREYYRKNLNIQNDLGETPLHSATSSFIMGNPYFWI